MEAQIPDAVKKRRQKLAMARQLKIARGISQSYVGRHIDVLVEREVQLRDLPKGNVSSWEHGLIRSSGTPDGPAASGRGPFLVARGQADAPDIDGRVYIRGKLPLGQFARVKIIGHTDYDLIAEAV
jgi:ribosomal protein S12 methylthiotransferase